MPDAAWLREPLGAHAEGPAAASWAADVSAEIVISLFSSSLLGPWNNGADLEPEVLRAVVETTDGMATGRAHFLLRERESLSEDQLLREWKDVPDDVLVDRLVEQAEAPPRFQAVEDLLRRRAPRALAQAWADRLLALPPELRPFGVSQIAQIASST